MPIKQVAKAPLKRMAPGKKAPPPPEPEEDSEEDSVEEEGSEEFDEEEGSEEQEGSDEDDDDEKDGEEDDEEGDEEGDEEEEEDEPRPKHPHAVRTMDEFLGGSGSEEEEELPFEREAREHEEGEAAVAAEAAADFRAELDDQPKFTLPSRQERRAALQPKVAQAATKADEDGGAEDSEDDEGEEAASEEGEEAEEGGELVPPAVLKERIGAVVEVLSDFKNRRVAGRPRADYMAQLAR
jgi:hypothetical protein